MNILSVYRSFAEQDLCQTSELTPWSDVINLFDVEFRKNNEFAILREKNSNTKLFCIFNADTTKPVKLIAWTFLDKEKVDENGNAVIVHMGKIVN